MAAANKQRSALNPLLFSYSALAQLYGTAASSSLRLRHVESLAHSIGTAEQQTASTARSLGLPFCAPVAPGTA